MTLEGVTYTADTAAPYYTLLYRTGIIEAVDAHILNRQYEGRWIIPSTALAEAVRDAVAKYLRVLQDLGVAAPVYVFMSMLGAKDRWMGVSAAFGDNGYPIDRDLIQLPEAVVLDLTHSPDSIMRGPIDSVWNACGFAGSPNFDAQGRWQGRS